MAPDSKNIDNSEEYDSLSNSGNIGFPDYNDNENESNRAQGDLSLEAILAEYKGSAFIQGDKRTPASVLQEKTERIIMEVSSKEHEETQVSSAAEKTSPDKNIKKERSVVENPETQPDSTTDYDAQSTGDKKKDAVIPFSRFRRTPIDSRRDIEDEVKSAIEEQTRLEEESKRSVGKFFGLFNRDMSIEDEVEESDNDVISEKPVPIREEEVFEEPDYKEATKRFAERCNSYSLRSLASLIITIIMAILTLLFESGATLPFGISNTKAVPTGILMILFTIVMLLSIDKLIAGITDIVKRGMGIETLNLFSCLATIAAALFGIYAQDTTDGMPYLVVSAFSLTFMLWAEKVYYRALTESMKTAQAAALPFGVIAETTSELDYTIIKKVPGRTAGFYNNLIQADITEAAYIYATPMLIIASAALALYASVGRGQAVNFFHHFAAIMAAAAPFSALFSFAVPFSAISRRARQSGAAIAGWGGADDMYHTDGVSITDEDMFPHGTVSINGIKIFEEVSPDKALRYTASLIIASNSGLTKVFSEMLSKKALNLIRVEDFACYEGGIGGKIKGERVITGSAAFMNLMGIRVPTSLNMKNAIFTAINKKLIAVFSINYVPIKSVQNALVSVLKYHVKLFFAVRDFNITPVMLEQKFKVPVNDVEYVPIQNTYELSDDKKQEAKRVSAILIREGMGPYVESITGGRRLRTTALVATIASLLSAVAGMLIMFTICWAGSFAAASAGNLMLFMLSMLVVVLIICGFAKYRQ